MKLAKRSRKRGEIERAIFFAEQRAARLSTAPPLARSCAAPTERPLRSPTLLARKLPWGAVPEGWSDTSAGTLLIVADGCHFAGGYSDVEVLRAVHLERSLVVADAFVDELLVERAYRAGADALAPPLGLLSRRQAQEAVFVQARARGLAVVPECSSPGDLELARAEGCREVLVSARHRDHFRLDASSARSLCEAACGAGLSPWLLFAEDLPQDDLSSLQSAGANLVPTRALDMTADPP